MGNIKIVVHGEKGPMIFNCNDSPTGYILIDLNENSITMDYWPPDKKWPPAGLEDTLKEMIDILKE